MVSTPPEKPHLRQTIENSIGMEFVLIPPGSFMMGSHTSPGETSRRYGGNAKFYRGEHQQHKVTISKAFYLQSTLITQGQWRQVMGDNPSRFKECGDDCPVEQVSWDDTQDFIKKLNEMEGTDKYHLPTEAEWEYACRAGTTAEFLFGDDVSKLHEYAWYWDNSKKRTHPVGEKKPNDWDLYDMHGNVWEWVEDDWHNTYDGAPADGSAWVDKKRRANQVVRGVAQGCRSAFRGRHRPADHGNGLGFRLSRSGTLGP